MHVRNLFERTPALCQWLAPCILLGTLCFGETAEAAGFWTLERGVSNFGRGGANFVMPEDPIAVYSNPAALAGLRGLQLMIDANMVLDHRTFKRAADDLDNDGTFTDYPQVSGAPALSPSPGFFASYNFASVGVEDLTIGLGLYGPVKNDRSWPADGPQRYSEIRSRNLQVHYALAAAYQLPFWNMRIGVTGMLISQRVRTDVDLHLPGFTGNLEDPRFDVQVELVAEDGPLPSGIFALSAQPLAWLAFGGSYQLGWDVDATGDIGVVLGEEADRLGDVVGDQVRVRASLPAIARAAVRVIDPKERFDVEFAFVWEQWSKYSTVNIEPQGIRFVADPVFGGTIEDVDIPTIQFTNNLRDTYSLRLGGQWRTIEDRLTTRAGVFFERAAVAAATLSPNGFERDRIGGTLGARVDLPAGIWLDGAAGYVHWRSKTVRNSEIFLIDPLTDPPDQLHPIANGRYENWQIVAMLSLGIEIDI